MGKTFYEIFNEYKDTCQQVYEYIEMLKNDSDFARKELEKFYQSFDATTFSTKISKKTVGSGNNISYYQDIADTAKEYQKLLAFYDFYKQTYQGMKLADNPVFDMDKEKKNANLQQWFDNEIFSKRIEEFQQEFKNISESLENIAVGKKKLDDSTLYKAPNLKKKTDNIYYRGEYNGPDTERLSYDEALSALAQGEKVTVYNGFSKKGTMYEPKIENGEFVGLNPTKVTRPRPKDFEDSFAKGVTKQDIFHNMRELVDAQEDLLASDHWYTINGPEFIKVKSRFSKSIDKMGEYLKAPDPNKLEEMYNTFTETLASINSSLIDVQSGKTTALFCSKEERIDSLMRAKDAIEQTIRFSTKLFNETGIQMEEKFDNLSEKTGDPQKDKENLMNMVKMYRYSSEYSGRKSEDYDEENPSYKIITTRENLKDTFIKTIEDAKAKDIDDLGKKLGLNKNELKEFTSVFGKDGATKVKNIIKDNNKEPILPPGV